MARTFSGTATTNPATLTITGSPAYAVHVKNTGSVNLLVNVPAVHGDDYDQLEPDDVGVYNSPKGDIGAIKVKTASSTASYLAGVTNGAA